MVTATTFVAISTIKLKTVSQPSTKVSQGTVLPSTPQMYISLELEPFDFTDGQGAQYRLYRFPDSLLSGFISLQLLPVSLQGSLLDRDTSIRFANFFSGSRCVSFAGSAFSGSCSAAPQYGNETGLTSTEFTLGVPAGYILGGIVVPEAAQFAYLEGDHRVLAGGPLQYLTTGAYAEATPGIVPTWVSTISFPAFTWQQGGTGAASVVPGGSLEVPGTTEPTTFTAMTIEREPATIELLNQPPPLVQVGTSFVLECKVRISSGMPLGSATITAQTTSASGLSTNPAEYVMEAFNIAPSSLGPDKPALNAISATGITGADGVVRLVLEFVAGSNGDVVRLQVAASNGVISAPSSNVVLSTPLLQVNATNQSVDLTGLRGVGKAKGVLANVGKIGDEVRGAGCSRWHVISPPPPACLARAVASSASPRHAATKA